MSKILKILQCSNLGGMEQSVYRLLPEVSKMGFDFSIATPRPFGAGESILKRWDAAAIDHDYKGKFGWKSHFSFDKQLRQKAKHTDQIWITGTDIASLRATKNLTQPKLLGHHYHHLETPNSYVKWKLFYEIFCRQCDWITYPSNFVRNEGIKIAPWLKNRSSVVRQYFPIVQSSSEDKSAARQRLGLREDAFIVGNAGWLIQRKRWDIFLRVSEIVLSSGLDVLFVIGGGGPQENELKDRAKRISPDRIRFLGWMSEMKDFYQSLDVLLFNSDFDALPRTPGESMGHGVVPIVSLRHGGLAELVDHNVNGFFYPDHNVEEMAKRIKELKQQRSLLEGLRESAIETLRAIHSREMENSFYLEYFNKTR